MWLTSEHILRIIGKSFKVPLFMDDFEGQWHFTVGAHDTVFRATNISPDFIKLLMQSICLPRLNHDVIEADIGLNCSYIMRGHKYSVTNGYHPDDVCIVAAYLNTKDKNIFREGGYKRCQYSFGNSTSEFLEVKPEIQFSELF